VLALAAETPDSVAILDDALAGRHGKLVRILLTGTPGSFSVQSAGYHRASSDSR
jgi:hypothetical protein